MKKLYIEDGCIGCGTCQALCPEVFEVDGVSKVKSDADLERNKECIEEAAAICPVGVIKYKK
jgi:ferredoxin